MRLRVVMFYNGKTKEETKVGHDYQIYPDTVLFFFFSGASLLQNMLEHGTRTGHGARGTDAQDC